MPTAHVTFSADLLSYSQYHGISIVFPEEGSIPLLPPKTQHAAEPINKPHETGPSKRRLIDQRARALVCICNTRVFAGCLTPSCSAYLDERIIKAASGRAYIPCTPRISSIKARPHNSRRWSARFRRCVSRSPHSPRCARAYIDARVAHASVCVCVCVSFCARTEREKHFRRFFPVAEG